MREGFNSLSSVAQVKQRSAHLAAVLGGRAKASQVFLRSGWEPCHRLSLSLLSVAFYLESQDQSEYILLGLN